MDDSQSPRLSPSLWQVLDEACDRFEQAWQNGPAIANYLGNSAGPERNRLLHELLRLDIHHRKRSGSSKTEQEYAALLPSDAAAVQEYFKNLVVPVSDTQSVPGDTNRGHTSGDNSETDLPSWSAPRFRTIRSHAKGGLGEVFLAEDLEFQREVALKEIQRSKLDHAAARRDFSREGRITGRLEHPNIAPVYSLGQFEDGRPFYVMRFIRGASLKEAIARFHGASPHGKSAKDKPAPEAMSTQAEKAETATSQNRDLELRQLLGSFVQVCNAVAYAHSKGIIHRDIKPANIMLGDFGETLLVDWGLARATADVEGATGITGDQASEGSAATQQGQIKGTPAYMSPEQARGDVAQLGPATDVYSLGATLYTLLTGQIPVEGKSTDEYLTNVIAGRVTPPRLRTPQRAIAKPLDAICMKAMKLDPADRYASARLLAADIEHYLADERVSAYQEPITVRTRRWLRKHPAMATAASLLLLVGLAGSLGFAMLERIHGIEIAKKREESDQNYRSAKAAVERYTKTVLQDELLNEERFQPLLKNLLKDAKDFYQQLAEQNVHESERLPELASALMEVGNISLETGDVEVARNAFQRAAEKFALLVQHNPDSESLQNELAKSYNLLAVAMHARSELEMAKRNSERALEIRERLVQQSPSVADYWHNLAASHFNLGRMQLETSNLASASANFEKAIAIQQRLVQKAPTVHEFQDSLATTYVHLGNLQGNEGQLYAARASYERGLGVFQSLVQQHPAIPRYKSNLAANYNNLGILQRELSEFQAALSSFRQAAIIGEDLVKRNPNVGDFQRGLAGSCTNLGILQLDMFDLSGSRDSNLRAVEIYQNLVSQHPGVTEYRDGLATSHVNLGLTLTALFDLEGSRAHFQSATSILSELVLKDPSVSEYQCDLANALSNFGILQRRFNDLSGAIANTQKAVQIRQQLVKQFPESVQFQIALARDYDNLGLIQFDASGFAESESSFNRAIELGEMLIRRFPSNSEYQIVLANSYNNLGNLLYETSDRNEARTRYERAIALREELAKGPFASAGHMNDLAGSLVNLAAVERDGGELSLACDLLMRAASFQRNALQSSVANPTFRRYFRNNRKILAGVKLQSDSHTEATSVAREWAEYANNTADAVEAVANICHCIALAKKDATLSEEAKKQAVQEYGNAAMEILTKLVNEGINGERLTDPAALNRPEFLPLTLRKDFQELLGALSAGRSEVPAESTP